MTENIKYEKHITSQFSKIWWQIVVKYMCTKFLKTAWHTQKTEKVCSLIYLKNSQVWQNAKLMILSMSCLHAHDLSRPALCKHSFA